VGDFEFVHWRVMLYTHSPDKAARLLARLSEALGLAVEASETEPYWKDPAVTQARFRTALNASSPAEAVFGVLLQGSRVSSGWQTSGPQEYEGNRWEFEALSASGSRISGVDWMVCRTANFEDA
jgi:hypothetical protein